MTRRVSNRHVQICQREKQDDEEILQQVQHQMLVNVKSPSSQKIKPLSLTAMKTPQMILDVRVLITVWNGSSQ